VPLDVLGHVSYSRAAVWAGLKISHADNAMTSRGQIDLLGKTGRLRWGPTETDGDEWLTQWLTFIPIP